MQWYQTIFEVIDMRSFSNLWFWIALAVLWSSTSHWVIGVPFDMIHRARRHGGQAQEDLEEMVRINVNRLMHIARVSGMWLAGIAAFVLTLLVLLGFYYDVEFAQAVFCLFFPMSIVGGLSLYTAYYIETHSLIGKALDRRLILHRLLTQVIGMFSILGTSMWGMFQNLNLGPM